MNTIDDILVRFNEKCKPSDMPHEEQLKRYQMQMDALMALARDTVEAKMPGWGKMVLHVQKRIDALTKDVALTCEVGSSPDNIAAVIKGHCDGSGI